MKILPFIVMFAVSVSGIAQIGAKTQQSKIYGTWVNNNFGYQLTLTLGTDGSGQFDGDAIKFTSQGNKLVITQEGHATTYDFILQANSLTVSGGDLDTAITFARSGSIREERLQTKTQVASAASGDLTGSWTGYGETITFNNGLCEYQGQTYAYTVSENEINLQTSQGNRLMAYSLSGNHLNLTINGQVLTYTQAVKNASATSLPSAGGNMDMSLVGKWCYVNVTSTNSGGTSTDECITLNNDGTYSYYSERSLSANTSSFSAGTASQDTDSGTWRVEGDRIHYNSKTQGQGSYQLTKKNHPKSGDPMIVLDGTSYVTYYQKSPW